MKKRIMLTLVCLLAAIGWVAAQNSPITGIVISAEDNEPIIEIGRASCRERV